MPPQMRQFLVIGPLISPKRLLISGLVASLPPSQLPEYEMDRFVSTTLTVRLRNGSGPHPIGKTSHFVPITSLFLATDGGLNFKILQRICCAKVVGLHVGGRSRRNGRPRRCGRSWVFHANRSTVLDRSGQMTTDQPLGKLIATSTPATTGSYITCKN